MNSSFRQFLDNYFDNLFEECVYCQNYRKKKWKKKLIIKLIISFSILLVVFGFLLSIIIKVRTETRNSDLMPYASCDKWAEQTEPLAPKEEIIIYNDGTVKSMGVIIPNDIDSLLAHNFKTISHSLLEIVCLVSIPSKK